MRPSRFRSRGTGRGPYGPSREIDGRESRDRESGDRCSEYGEPDEGDANGRGLNSCGPGSRDPGRRDPDDESLQKAAELTAVRLLARREHSVEELRRKLLVRGHPEAAVVTVLARLEAKRLVSDDRFVASFVRHHAQRGQGPVRIRAELRQQGIGPEVADTAIEDAEVDWMSQAAAVRRRKFGAAAPRAAAERAKQSRFLQYRGFSSDQIRAAMKSSGESPDSFPETDPGFEPDPEV
jgi:regulatory protein